MKILLGIILTIGAILFVNRLWFSTPNDIQKVAQENTTQKQVPSNNTVKEITHGNTSKKQVIFTFDGGALNQSAAKVLEALAKHKVKSTFFLTGKFIETYPDIVKQILAQGDEIFNHTYDHPHLTALSDKQITDELAKMEDSLLALANVSSKPYFRAPYGARDLSVLKLAKQAGYQSVYWSVDAMDWKQPKGETAEQVKNIILSKIAPGKIYLMHLGDTITGNILDDIFSTIETKGYKIVSLTQGL